MKIKINRNVLANALAEVAPFVPQKTPIAILKYAKVVTKGNRIKFEANDTQASIRKYVEAMEIDEDSEFLVDVDVLNKFVSKIKGDSVDIIVNSDTLTMRHSKGEAQFQSMPVADYPDFDMPSEAAEEVTIPSGILMECVNVARNFCGNDELRPILRPIYAYVEDGKFGYCATDTTILVHDEIAVEGADSTIDIAWLIEPSLFSSLVKACKNTENVTVKVTPTHVSYRIGNVIFQSVQTKGAFPNFRRVIQTQWTIECAVNKSDIMESLQRASLLCEDSRLIKLDIDRLAMNISADNISLLRKSSENIQHNGCNGEIKIGVSCDLALVCVRACDYDEIVMRMSDSTKPIIFYQANHPNRVHILMPMVINN